MPQPIERHIPSAKDGVTFLESPSHARRLFGSPPERGFLYTVISHNLCSYTSSTARVEALSSMNNSSNSGNNSELYDSDIPF